ncbi:MAG: META domain-containing protein [Micrococcales bacterium]|nr:META domain-containing protein [Micrococcales bacterium]
MRHPIPPPALRSLTVGLILIFGLAGCVKQQVVEDAPSPPAPASPEWSSVAGDDPVADAPDAVPEGKAEGCEDETSLFTCGGRFRAILGYDEDEAVTWIEDTDVRMEAVQMNGANQLVVFTPCNTLNIPVELGPGTLTPGVGATTMMLCSDEDMAKETWLASFFTSPSEFGFSDPNNVTITHESKRLLLVRA